MKDSENIISIKILDCNYQIKCPAEEAQELQSSAQYLDQQMRKIQQSSNIHNIDRIAVVAALNICQEVLQLKKQKNQYIDTMSQRITDLYSRIQNFLAAEEEIAV